MGVGLATSYLLAADISLLMIPHKTQRNDIWRIINFLSQKWNYELVASAKK